MESKPIGGTVAKSGAVGNTRARTARLTTLGIAIAAFGCNAVAARDDHLTTKRTMAVSGEGAAGVFSDDAFRTATGCPRCTVLNKTQLDLPLTNVEAASAKLRDSEHFYTATLLSNGDVADEQSLLRDERQANIATYGKLTPALHARIHSDVGESSVTVMIWEKFSDLRPSRESVSEMIAARTAIQGELVNSSTAILNKLAALSANVAAVDATSQPGTTAPVIIATLPISQVDELASLPEVAAVGSAERPIPTGQVWYDTIGGDTAHLYGNGAGVNICNAENDQPDDYSRLNVSGVRTTVGAPSIHTRWTTGIMKNTDAPTNSLAPNANTYIDDDNGTNWYYVVGNWCSQTASARFINRSVADSGSPGPSTLLDWYWDWVALHFPYPLVVSAAGNYGQVAGSDTVGNRQYNGLIVGGSDTMQTASVADDTVWGGAATPAASWRNFQTAHNDYELPHLMAPASYPVTAVGFSGSATSAATPQVTGAAAIVGQLATQLVYWPEGVRAVMLATAVPQPVDAARFESVSTGGDRAAGVGILNAGRAASLARPQYYWTGAATPSAYYRATVSPASFDLAGRWTTTFPTGPISGRLRAVIAWDGTPGGCAADGSNCTSTVLDADLDLHVFDVTSGTYVGDSSTWDSSYEAVDVAAVSGHSYELRVTRGAFNSSSTYIGVAWYNY